MARAKQVSKTKNKSKNKSKLQVKAPAKKASKVTLDNQSKWVRALKIISITKQKYTAKISTWYNGLHPDFHRLHRTIKRLVRVTDIAIVVSFVASFVAGFLFLSVGRPPEIAQAESFRGPFVIWNGEDNTTFWADELTLNSMLNQQQQVFLAAEYDEGLVRYQGRLPAASPDFAFERSNDELSLTIEAFSQYGIVDCQLTGNQEVNQSYQTIKGIRIIDDSGTANQMQLADITVETKTILNPEVVNKARQCLTASNDLLNKYGVESLELDILAGSVKNSPTNLTVKSDSLPDNSLIKTLSLCPCNNDRIVAIDQKESDWLRQEAATKQDGDYITVVANYQLSPRTNDSLSPDQSLTIENIAQVMGAVNTGYKGYLGGLVSVNGKPKTQIISDYNQREEEERKAEEARLRAINIANLARTITTSRSASPNTGVSTGGSSAITSGCFGGDATLGQLYCLINQYRQDNGRGVLSSNGAMQLAAFNHNQWMVANGSFTHVGENGTRFFDRCGAVSASCSTEILARASYTSASQCMVAWKASVNHNNALLTSSYTGIGASINGGFCTVVLR
jgi:uncharacterized protein YkwD